jgi:hypothetical protein
VVKRTGWEGGKVKDREMRRSGLLSNQGRGVFVLPY